VSSCFANAHSNGYSNRYSYSATDANSNGHLHAYSYSHSYCNRNGYCDSRNADADADLYSKCDLVRHLERFWYRGG
jgi:hypothetical protein